MDRNGAPGAALFLCLVHICLCLNNYVDPKLGDGSKSDISILLHFYFSQPIYYLLDPKDQYFGVKLKEKRA